MLRGPGGVLGCCGEADQLVESSWQRGQLRAWPRAADVDGGGWTSRSERRFARRVWSLPSYSSYCGGKRARRRVGWGEGVELQLKKQVKAAADIREGTSSVERNGPEERKITDDTHRIYVS